MVALRLCIHCGQRPANRPRRLCWGCYYTPGVKDQYQPVSVNGRRGVAGEAPLMPADSPTDALPGTEEKIEVLMRRAALGQALYHPMDAGQKKVNHG